jgi:predicted NUDIX family NTP pyrophosphohydrolase
MTKTSAGLLLWRQRGGELQVFLVHPGGPFWRKKDIGAWSIPKGEYPSDEEPLTAAIRETAEETGFFIDGKFVALDPLRQPSGKIVHAFAVEADVEAAAIISNTFSVEWPPRSENMGEFPEVDRAGWFSLSVAREKIHHGQINLIDQLEHLLGEESA